MTVTAEDILLLTILVMRRKYNREVAVANLFTELFFEKFGGRIESVDMTVVRSFSALDKKIVCLNFRIVFSNSNLFGSGSFSRSVYPRYRKMRHDWHKFLAEKGVSLGTRILVGFIPILSVHNSRGKSYGKGELSPVGTKVEKIAVSSPRYIKAVAKEFGSLFSLREPRGAYIGPEGGMLEAIKAINQEMDVSTMVDIGAGSGEISAYALKKFPLKKLHVNEISKTLSGHLASYLNKLKEEKRRTTTITYSFESCLRATLPKKADLVSVGVFYGFQPDFIRIMGRQLGRSLSEGILLIQSAMPEARFTLCLLEGADHGLRRWSWFNVDFALKKYFSNHQTILVGNQFITLASNSKNKLNRIIARLG